MTTLCSIAATRIITSFDVNQLLQRIAIIITPKHIHYIACNKYEAMKNVPQRKSTQRPNDDQAKSNITKQTICAAHQNKNSFNEFARCVCNFFASLFLKFSYVNKLNERFLRLTLHFNLPKKNENRWGATPMIYYIQWKWTNSFVYDVSADVELKRSTILISLVSAMHAILPIASACLP